MAIVYTGQPFWEIPAAIYQSSGISYLYPPALCKEMISATMDAMRKALSTGVVEYHVGSRGLKRFTLAELKDFLGFWNNMWDASIWGGSIVARRAIPTDT
jgi:hypothetical protein